MSELAANLREQPLGKRSAAVASHCEMAVWGKADGQASDFRWLAATSGFDGSITDFVSQIGLPDDAIVNFGIAIADELLIVVKAYPSRSADAFGRSGFSEKIVLTADLSADALAKMAAILPALDDRIWWEEDQSAWEDSEYTKPLEQLPLGEPADIVAAVQEMPSDVVHDGLAQYAAGQKPAHVGADLTIEQLSGLALVFSGDAWLKAQKDGVDSNFDIVGNAAHSPAEPAPESALAAHLLGQNIVSDGKLLVEEIYRRCVDSASAQFARAYLDIEGLHQHAHDHGLQLTKEDLAAIPWDSWFKQQQETLAERFAGKTLAQSVLRQQLQTLQLIALAVAQQWGEATALFPAEVEGGIRIPALLFAPLLDPVALTYIKEGAHWWEDACAHSVSIVGDLDTADFLRGWLETQ